MALSRISGWAGISRFGGIGDNLIAASPARALHSKGLKVEMITGDPAWVVFENNPFIDKLSIKTKREIPDDMLGWQRWFAGRSDEYDTFANLSHSCESSLAFQTAQTQFWWPDHVRRRIADHNYLEFVHDICGAPHEFGSLFFPTDAELQNSLETKMKVGVRCLCWSISGTRLDKIHPYSSMIIARIIKELNVPVVLMGAPGKNFADAQSIEGHVRRQNGSTQGLHIAISPDADNPTWPIRRSLAFAQHCDVVVGPDTGLMWSVAFEPMPKVMLLSHASPENITKHWINTTTLHADQARVPCWPCHRLHDGPDTCVANRENNGAACMTDIGTEAIMDAVKVALEAVLVLPFRSVSFKEG